MALSASFVVMAFVAMAMTTVNAQDLRITGIINAQRPGGLPKAMELVACTTIPDLSQYSVATYFNSATTTTATYTFPAVSVAAGQFIYFSNEIGNFTAYFGFAPTYNQVSVNNYNSNDVIILSKSTIRVDAFGVLGVDGLNTNWDYSRGWAYRVSGKSATTNFNVADWSINKGASSTTTNAAASLQFPVASYACNVPTSPPTNLPTSSPTKFPTNQPTTQPTNSNPTNQPTGPPSTTSNVSPPSSPPTALSTTSPTSSPSAKPSPLPTNTPTSKPSTLSATFISQVQGSGDSSPFVNQTVTVDAIVVGDFQAGDADTSRTLNGFYLQEEDSDVDGYPLTSEGIFVFDGTSPKLDVNVGDRVRVTGKVTENFGETQITAISTGSVVRISSGNPLPTPAQVFLAGNTRVTLNQNGAYQPDLEAYEGMLVVFPETLQIIEQFNLFRSNEIRLYSGSRPYEFTQLNRPDVTAYNHFLQDFGAHLIAYDDGLNTQDPGIDLLDGFSPYNDATAWRMGDSITNMTGVLNYQWAGFSSSGSTWRVRSVQNGSNKFVRTNPRPPVPDVGGNLRIVSQNLLNFFATLPPLLTGPTHNVAPRGANNQAEFDRHIQKEVTMLTAVNADIYLVVEMENEFTDQNGDGKVAIQLLVDAMNARVGSNTFAWVYPGAPFVDDDVISPAFIYKTARMAVAPGSHPAFLTDSDLTASQNLPIFDGVNSNRAPLAVTFVDVATNFCLTLAGNHFKSKGGPATGDVIRSSDVDANDGAGYWNQRRLDAAQALTAWLATHPTGYTCENVAILGDLNSYAMEDPIEYLASVGYSNVEPSTSYSYVFSGQIGTLDYILTNQPLSARVTGAAVWHINEDESSALDYNLDFNRPAGYFNGFSPARNSDHSTIIVGVNTTVVTAAPTTSPSTQPTTSPTSRPTPPPSLEPNSSPSSQPTVPPTAMPSLAPTSVPTSEPTQLPTSQPTTSPTLEPTTSPTAQPTTPPSANPSPSPTTSPTSTPTQAPTRNPTSPPTRQTTNKPSGLPTIPTAKPKRSPRNRRTAKPTLSPTTKPTLPPFSPTKKPIKPTVKPNEKYEK